MFHSFEIAYDIRVGHPYSKIALKWDECLAIFGFSLGLGNFRVADQTKPTMTTTTATTTNLPVFFIVGCYFFRPYGASSLHFWTQGEGQTGPSPWAVIFRRFAAARACLRGLGSSGCSFVTFAL
jgi:hypothetical protein